MKYINHFIVSKNMHIFRVLVATFIIVFFWLATRREASYYFNDASTLILNILGYSLMLWLYYCVVHVMADLYTKRAKDN